MPWCLRARKQTTLLFQFNFFPRGISCLVSSFSLKAREREELRENTAPLLHVKVMTQWSRYIQGQSKREHEEEEESKTAEQAQTQEPEREASARCCSLAGTDRLWIPPRQLWEESSSLWDAPALQSSLASPSEISHKGAAPVSGCLDR